MRRSLLSVLVLFTITVASQTIDDLDSVEAYYDSLDDFDPVSIFSGSSDTVKFGTPGVGYHTKYGPIGGVQTDKINIEKLTITKAEYTNGTLSDELMKSITSLQKRVASIMEKDKNYSVTYTSKKPPNNNPHYYFSLAPYSWPNCKGKLLITDPWTQCPWTSQDGKVLALILFLLVC
jgi:hypothetical protein